MSKTARKYGILVAVDGSPESDAALGWATSEAVMRHLPLTLMHVIAPVVVSWPVRYLKASYAAWQEDNAKHVIEQAQKSVHAAASSSNPSIQIEICHDGVVRGLISASRKATLTVVGSRGLGAVGGSILGSVSRGLLHYARSPVAVIRPQEPTADATAPVLLGIDGSPASETATELAFDEASRRGVDLVALHAWSDVSVVGAVGVDWSEYQQEGHEVLAERLAGWQEQYPEVHVRREIVCDRPANWLIEHSGRSQLVVLGSRGRGGFTRLLLGSVSTTVAEASKAPVIVVRS